MNFTAMNWTQEKLDEETTRLQPRDEGDMISRGVKHGRPKKPQTIKTKLKDDMVNMRLGMVQMRTEMNERFGAMQIEFGGHCAWR